MYVYPEDYLVAMIWTPILTDSNTEGNGRKMDPESVKKASEARRHTYKMRRFQQYKDILMGFEERRATSKQIADKLGFDSSGIAHMLKVMTEEFPNNFYKCGEIKRIGGGAGRNTSVWAFKEVEEKEVLQVPYIRERKDND